MPFRLHKPDSALNFGHISPLSNYFLALGLTHILSKVMAVTYNRSALLSLRFCWRNSTLNSKPLSSFVESLEVCGCVKENSRKARWREVSSGRTATPNPDRLHSLSWRFWCLDIEKKTEFCQLRELIKCSKCHLFFFIKMRNQQLDSKLSWDLAFRAIYSSIWHNVAPPQDRRDRSYDNHHGCQADTFHRDMAK